MDPMRLDDLMAHPLAHLIPPMRKDEWEAFFDDVTIYGIKEPVTVHGNVIVDGHHRWKAAKELGLEEIPTKDVVLEDGESANELVCRLNLFRRHLSDDQRAMVAAKWAKENPKRIGRPPKTLIAAHGGTDLFEEDDADDDGKSPRALERAAKIFSVSAKKARKAAEILKSNNFFGNKVHSGELSLSAAKRKVRAQRNEPGTTAAQIAKAKAKGSKPKDKPAKPADVAEKTVRLAVETDRKAVAAFCKRWLKDQNLTKEQRAAVKKFAAAVSRGEHQEAA